MTLDKSVQRFTKYENKFNIFSFEWKILKPKMTIVLKLCKFVFFAKPNNYIVPYAVLEKFLSL